MRSVLVGSIVLGALLAVGSTPSLGSETASATYIVPAHGLTVCPTGITNMEPVCIGGAIVKSPSGSLYTTGSAVVLDDVSGAYVPFAICAGDDMAVEGCEPGPIVCGPDAVATDEGAFPDSTISIFILSFFVPAPGGEPCFGTTGTVTVTFG